MPVVCDLEKPLGSQKNTCSRDKSEVMHLSALALSHKHQNYLHVSSSVPLLMLRSLSLATGR